MVFKVATPKTLSLAAKHLSSHDPVLAPIIEAAGIATITPHKNYYQELVESIISQQLSIKAIVWDAWTCCRSVI